MKINHDHQHIMRESLPPDPPSKQEFHGGQKRLDHVLLFSEKAVIAALLPVVPQWMSTVHLTLMTLVWSAGVILFGYWSSGDIRWLWGFSVCIGLQHITDMLDGAVGRARNTGLVKWGFYADHFLDYVFLCSIIIGYSFLLPSTYSHLVIVCLAVSGGLMVHVLLDFAITNDYKISVSRFGVSEMRWVLIILNLLLVVFGDGLLAVIFPGFVLLSLAVLVGVVWRSQAIYRRMDIGR